MTRWGLFLLVAFIALGLSPLPRRTAERWAVLIVASVIVAFFVHHGAL